MMDTSFQSSSRFSAQPEEWPVRSYYKSDLAAAYAPGLTLHAALNRLAAWIHQNGPLEQALQQTGYQPRQRAFSPKQVGLIFEYLGKP